MSDRLSVRSTFEERLDARLAEVRAAGRWRAPRVFDAKGVRGTLEVDAGRKEVVSFATNDYLGLSTHNEVVAAAKEAIDRYGLGATSARLMSGSRPIHAELEGALAAHHGCERAVLFATGYQANIGVLTALGTDDVVLICDERNHASLIDGARLGRASVRIYPHGDLVALSELLASADADPVVVTDSIFSMDGDRAPLEGVADLCVRYGAALVVDDAHGVLSSLDAISGAQINLIIVGTLSKTLGSQGGYVASDARVASLLENLARTYIFTTALSIPNAAGALAALRVLESDDGAQRMARLRSLSARLTGKTPEHVVSPIVPVIVGEERRALEAASVLLEHGLFVPAIRPPTVAPDSSRLRVSFSATHRDEDLDSLERALRASGLAGALLRG